MKNDNNTHPLAAIENAAQIVVRKDGKPLLAGCATSPVQAGCVAEAEFQAGCVVAPVSAGCAVSPIQAGCVVDAVGVMAKRK